MDSGQWPAFVISMVVLLGLAVGYVARVIHVRRHPMERMTRGSCAIVDLSRAGGEILWVCIYGAAIFLAGWMLLSWMTHGFHTGHWALRFPKASPWQRFMHSHQARPWNFIVMAVGIVAPTALVYRRFYRALRQVDSAVRETARQLGLPFQRRATFMASEWWMDHLRDRLLGTMSLSAGEDLAFICNRCWAVYDAQDTSRILLVAHGPNPAITPRDSRSAIWVCLYIHRTDRRGHLLSDETQRLLRERKFWVDAHQDYARIIDRREYQSKGAQMIREATAPERLVELWCMTSALAPDRSPKLPSASSGEDAK